MVRFVQESHIDHVIFSVKFWILVYLSSYSHLSFFLFRPFIFLSALSLALSTCLSTFFFLTFSHSQSLNSLFLPLSVCLSVHLSLPTSLSIYLSFCVPIYLPICLSIYQSFSPFSSSHVNEASRSSCHQVLKTVASVIVIQSCNAALQVSLCK